MAPMHGGKKSRGSAGTPAVHERTARRLMHRLEYDGYVTRERVRSPFEPTERLRSLAASLLQDQTP